MPLALNHHLRTLQAQLARSRTAMLWAIAEKQPDKAKKHAMSSARLVRLISACQKKYGGRVKP